jgi:hypothetical protein
MRAAVERCAELEAALAKVTAERDAARYVWMDAATREVERADRAEASLTRVTAERDAARRMAEIRLRAIESIRHASMRDTPTEGE